MARPTLSAWQLVGSALMNGVMVYTGFTHSGSKVLIAVQPQNGIGLVSGVRVRPDGSGPGGWVAATAVDEHQSGTHPGISLRLYAATIAAGTIDIEITTTDYDNIVAHFASATNLASYGTRVKQSAIGNPSLSSDADDDTSLLMLTTVSGGAVDFTVTETSAGTSELFESHKMPTGPKVAGYLREASGVGVNVAADIDGGGGGIFAAMLIPLIGTAAAGPEPTAVRRRLQRIAGFFYR
jgi:hypothetical protein